MVLTHLPRLNTFIQILPRRVKGKSGECNTNTGYSSPLGGVKRPTDKASKAHPVKLDIGSLNFEQHKMDMYLSRVNKIYTQYKCFNNFGYQIIRNISSMSVARTIDGLTGELVGGPAISGGYGYGAQGATYTETTTNQYVGGANQYVGGTVIGGAQYGATTVLPGATSTTYKTEYVMEPGQVAYNVVQPATTTYNVVQPATTQYVSTAAVSTAEIIKGESRIEYIPFEQTVTDYELREYVERIPRQRTITEYEERRYMETIPREVSKTDYYAIEYLKQYIPQIIPETKVEMVAVERIVTRTEYIPVERKIVHYPQAPLVAEVGLVSGGIIGGVVGGATTTTVTRGTTVGAPYISGSYVGGAPVIGGSYVGGAPVIGGSYIGGTVAGGALAGSTYATTTGPIVSSNAYRSSSYTSGGLVGAPGVIVGGSTIGGPIGGTVIGGRQTYVGGPAYTTTEYTSGPVQTVTYETSYGNAPIVRGY